MQKSFLYPLLFLVYVRCWAKIVKLIVINTIIAQGTVQKGTDPFCIISTFIRVLWFTRSGMAVNARIIRLLTSTAVSDLNTLLSIAIPFRVKAKGLFLLFEMSFAVAICDRKSVTYSSSITSVVAICDRKKITHL